MGSGERLQDMHYREAFEFTTDMIYVLDRSGNPVEINPAGLMWLELPHGCDPPQTLLSFLHEDDRARYQNALRELLTTGEEAHYIDGRIVGMRGRVTQASHRLKALRDGDGSISGALGIARDVSELRRLEQQAHHSQKLESIGMLTGGIAHDFNNMLAAILGYTELMLEEKDPDDPEYRALSYIHTSTERAAGLAKQLLIFSRRTGAELKPVQIGALIKETLHILQRTLPKYIHIIDRASECEDQVIADAGRLQQALMNLCLNARDAMPSGGELRLDVESLSLETLPETARTDMRPGSYIRIRVQDTGVGIPPNVLEHIYDPFFTTKPAGEGTGLGLSVVRGIMQVHGGHVQVESQPGRGTTFYLYLPAASDADLNQAKALSEPPGGSETILAVDDEPMLLNLLHDILHSKGYRVITASSAEEALQYVETLGDRIDLCITDNMMPGMSGKDLASRIRVARPAMRLLMCSGLSPTRESEITEPVPGAVSLHKPYQRRELLACVRRILDSPASADQE